MAPTPADIRPITPADAPAYSALRLAMLADAPIAFSGSPDADPWLDPAHVRRWLRAPGHAIIGAFASGRLIGAAGLARDAQPKLANRALLWGAWVEPGSRGAGVGEAALRAAIGHARSWPGVLVVRRSVGVGQHGARRLYERLGFTAWGTEPGTLRHEGELHDEVYMQMRVG